MHTTTSKLLKQLNFQLTEIKFKNCMTLLKVIIFIFHNLEEVPVYAVPARSITKKHWLPSSSSSTSRQCIFEQSWTTAWDKVCNDYRESGIVVTSPSGDRCESSVNKAFWRIWRLQIWAFADSFSYFTLATLLFIAYMFPFKSWLEVWNITWLVQSYTLHQKYWYEISQAEWLHVSLWHNGREHTLSTNN